MANRQYVGARYVPKFADPVEWNGALSYEALTIVTHLGNSFTSKKPVPAGVDIGNGEYWVNTGNYNEQVERYTQEVEAIKPYASYLNLRDFGAKGDGTDDTAAFNAWLTKLQETGNAGFIPEGNFTISTPVQLNNPVTIIGAGKNSALVFSTDGFIFGENVRGCVLSNFSIVTSNTSNTGITVKGNQHRLQNLYFHGANIESGNSAYYWATNIALSNAWYCVIIGCETMGGPYHSETVSYNRGIGIKASAAVNCKLDSCVLLYHDTAIQATKGTEALIIDGCIAINNNVGFSDFGYVDNCLNTVLDMCVNTGIVANGEALTVSNVFIAQHYYAPQKDNPEYSAITITSTSKSTTLLGVTTRTTSQPNVGFDVNGNGSIIIGCNLSWFKTGIKITANDSVVTGNIVDSAATADITVNGNYNTVTANKLSNDKLIVAGNNNATQHSKYTLYVPVTFTGQSSASFSVDLPADYFYAKPTGFVMNYPFGGFTCRVNNDTSTATKLELIFEGVGGNLPTNTGTLIITVLQ